MKFRFNAAGHTITAGSTTEEVQEKEFWDMLKRQVKSMPHNRGK